MRASTIDLSRRGFLIGLGAVGTAAALGAAAGATDVLERTGWSALAHQRFMYPPVFAFSPVAGAAIYRCTLSWQDTQSQRSKSVQSPKPHLDLREIWPDLPPSGTFAVLAAGIDADGKSIAEARFKLDKAARFKGPYRPAKTDYIESGAKAALWVLSKANDAKALEFPILFTASYNEALLRYASLHPNDQNASAAVEQATNNGRALLAASTPADWVYANMPPSHKDRGVLQLPRCGMAGMLYLDLFAATHDDRFLFAASRIGDTLRKTQFADGRWPFRVDPQTGKVLMDYTSDQSEIVILLDRLIQAHDRTDLAPTRDQAVAWLLANPCKTFHWQQQYEDVPLLPPYQNLEWLDVATFIPYLLRNATTTNGYEKLATDLFRYIEDQFVDWEPAGNYITPGVREQYVCYHVIDAHLGLFIRVCQALHAHTKDDIYIKKARAMADTLTAVQHPDGYYPTWMNHKPANDNPTELREITYRDIWANCTAIAAASLMRLGEYLKA